jgi:CBS domain containing-hemolysin-like protein
VIVAFAFSILLLVMAAGLRASLASLIRTPRADALRDAAEGDDGARRVSELLEDRTRLQPAIGMVHSALLVAAALPAAWAATELTYGWRLILLLVVFGLALVVSGELLPRAWGRDHPRRLAYRLAPMLDVACRLGDRATDLVTEDDVPDVPENPNEEAAQDEEERRLITSVLEFSETIVREVMVPRTDMVTIGSDVSSDEALDVVIEHGFSRVPVTGEGTDDIVGFAYAKDLLRIMDQGAGPQPVAELMRSVYFVPETKRVSDLLRDMQAGKVHMAVVVDEFGGTAGLVTIEDLLEELVGEIVDEFDTEVPLIEKTGEHDYLIDARLSVEDLAQLLHVELPHEEWDTVGGLVLGLAGRVPRENEFFEHEGVTLTVVRVQGRRVAQVHASIAYRIDTAT